MDIDQLRTFCQLADDRNYRIASEHLCITQSALTKKIQRLEAYTGITLFERGRNGAELTQAGLTLLPEAKRMVASFEDFQTLTNSVAEGTTGHLNIGFGISSYQIAPQAIAQFKQINPNVHVTLNDTPSQHQTDALLHGELQLSFNRLPVAPPLKGIPLLSDHLVIAINKNRLVEEDRLWEFLANIDYLRLNPTRGRGLTQQVDTVIHELQQTLIPTQEADDILTLLALVSADLGFTIVPSSVKNIANQNIRFISLNSQSSEWDVGLIWNEDKPGSVRENFVRFVTNRLNRN